MGALAALTMAENAPPTDSAPPRPLHPFFAPNRSSPFSSNKLVVKDTIEGIDNSAPPSAIAASGKTEEDAAEPPTSRPGRRRKADAGPVNGETQKTTRPRKRTRHSTEGDIANHFVKLGKETATVAEKEDAAVSGGPSDSPQNEHSPTTAPEQAIQSGCDTPLNDAKVGSTISGTPTNNGTSAEPAEGPPSTSVPTKPKKLLQFNPKTGTIGSPPRSKVSSAAGEANNSEKKSAPKRGRKPARRILSIVYGNDPESRVRIGELINAILNKSTSAPASEPEQLASASIKDQAPESPKALKASNPPKQASPKSAKSTHPFFLGQAKRCNPVAEDSSAKKTNSSPVRVRTKQYTSTPCSPRKRRVGPSAKMPIPQFGVKNPGLKVPGAKLPAWPWKDVVHVRGTVEMSDFDDDPLPLPSRKSKGNMVKVSRDESVVAAFTRSMDIQEMASAVRNINTDEFTPPPPELRLPQKHFESGRKLQLRIVPELRTLQPTLGTKPNGVTATMKIGLRPPPELARLFSSVVSSLSAFDMSQCETANWVQKYAPTNAAEILQPDREAFLLRDWLQALMVQSVDTGLPEAGGTKTGGKSKATGAVKKRRKKLDGFIVSSDDEDYDLQELLEEDDNWAPSGNRGILRKTVVKPSSKGRDGDKTANALVISGPHGCGKTAAVYAVAKELGFEVFEINPSSRRAGKDVLEKIGDMTRNHHVQQHQSSGRAGDQDTEDEVAKDIKSGKQPTMGSFFKPKSSTAKHKRPESSSAQNPQKEVIKKEPPKTQRQSLILLEEADILYEEDKQFWTTVVGLIAQSKRPFIMTCNDETLVPLQTLFPRLHGIFRLGPPPRDLAVDRLLLIAANEGHALTRQAVEQLYDSRNQDLRAATMDLQYWCQIGVGDRRGGFDWFYLRWPKGIDLDENKEVVRVVSEGTYQPGMNLLGRDNIIDPRLTPRFVEEEILGQAWESWGFDLGHWQDSVGLKTWSEDITSAVTTRLNRLDVLEAYDGLAEAMSVADICSQKSFASFMEEAMDTTQPEPPAKARDDCVLGRTPLDTSFVAHYHSLSVSLASSLKSLARSLLQSPTEKLAQHAAAFLAPLDEGQAIRCLQTNFTSTLPGTPSINRMDFAFAFDPIATAETASPQPASYLDPSVFDRTMELITLDVAPYVRSIVAYDMHLQQQRLKLSSLVSEGGKGSKRMRTTRSALSALEGGSRSTTRGEKWFKADINPYLVAKTAGEGWNGSDPEGSEALAKAQASPGSSRTVSPDTTPTQTPKKEVSRRGKKRQRVLQGNDVDELG